MAAVPLLYRQAIREGDLGLFALLVWALVLRLAASMVGYYIAFGVYGGVADAHRYLDDGAAVADNFRHLIFSPGVGRWTDTSLPTLLVGTVQTLIGPTSLGTYLVFSWIGFWGLFLLYRAFTIGVPEGSRRSYARLVFFLPSLLFWPSVVGKEAWMVFGLGLAAFGGARLLVTRVQRGGRPDRAGNRRVRHRSTAHRRHVCDRPRRGVRRATLATRASGNGPAHQDTRPSRDGDRDALPCPNDGGLLNAGRCRR